MKKKRDWGKVADELCTCGAKKSEHINGYMGCPKTNCARFTWKCFLDAKGKAIK